MSTPKNPCPQIRVSIQFIEPKFAQRLLGSNLEHQRTIAPTNLRKIEASLKDDDFMFNGQSMIVDEDGRLLDGQHRAQASVNTGIGFWTVFVSNVPSEYFKYMDCGKARTFGDVLKTMGKSRQVELAATLTRMAEYLKNPASVGAKNSFAHSELLDVLEMCPGIENSIQAVQPCSKLMPNSQLGWLYYLANQENPEMAQEFFYAFSTGQGLTKTSPLYHLRQRIENDRADGFHSPVREMLALLVKTWNNHISGNPVKALKWQTSEPFPILVLPRSNAEGAVA